MAEFFLSGENDFDYIPEIADPSSSTSEPLGFLDYLPKDVPKAKRERVSNDGREFAPGAGFDPGISPTGDENSSNSASEPLGFLDYLPKDMPKPISRERVFSQPSVFTQDVREFQLLGPNETANSEPSGFLEYLPKNLPKPGQRERISSDASVFAHDIQSLMETFEFGEVGDTIFQSPPSSPAPVGFLGLTPPSLVIIKENKKDKKKDKKDKKGKETKKKQSKKGSNIQGSNSWSPQGDLSHLSAESIDVKPTLAKRLPPADNKSNHKIKSPSLPIRARTPPLAHSTSSFFQKNGSYFRPRSPKSRTLDDSSEALSLDHDSKELFPKTVKFALTENGDLLSLSYLLAFIDDLGAESTKKMEKMTLNLAKLHGEPEDLFLVCFDYEMQTSKELSVVMRQLSPSVCILKCILEPFRRSLLMTTTKLLRLGKNKKTPLLLTEKTEDCSKISSLKEKFQAGIEQLLDSSRFPPPLCVFCYRCVQAINIATSLKIDKETNVKNWVITSLFFLRFLVPVFTNYRGDDEKTKGMVLVGRFLMKLCCRTLFNQQPVLNEVLENCFPLFDRYCAEVVEIGRGLAQKEVFGVFAFEKISSGNISTEEYQDFFDYVSDPSFETKLEKSVERMEDREREYVLQSHSVFKK